MILAVHVCDSLDDVVFRGELHQVAVEKWPVVSDDIRQQMARMAAVAAWGLGKALLNI